MGAARPLCYFETVAQLSCRKSPQEIFSAFGLRFERASTVRRQGVQEACVKGCVTSPGRISGRSVRVEAPRNIRTRSELGHEVGGKAAKDWQELHDNLTELGTSADASDSDDSSEEESRHDGAVGACITCGTAEPKSVSKGRSPDIHRQAAIRCPWCWHLPLSGSSVGLTKRTR